MIPAKKDLKNFTSLALVQGGNYLFPFIVLPYITRIIGVKLYGEIEYAIALVSFFIVFVNFGFDIIGTQKIAIFKKNRVKTNKIISSIFFTKLAIFLIGSLFFILLTSFFYADSNLLLFYYAYLTCIGYLFFPVWLFAGLEDTTKVAIFNGLGKGITFLFVIILINEKKDYILYPLIISISQIISGIAAFVLAKHKYDFSLIYPGSKRIKTTIKEAFPTATSELMIVFYSAGFIIILGELLDKEAVGLYIASSKIALIAQNILIIPFNQAVFPKFSRLAVESLIKLKNALVKTSLSLIFIFFTIGLIISIYSHEIILLIFGDSFISAAPLLKIFAFLPLCMAINNLVSYQGLLAIKKYKSFLGITKLISIITLIMIWFLVPHYGIMAAVWIRIGGQLLTVLASLMIMHNLFKENL